MDRKSIIPTKAGTMKHKITTVSELGAVMRAARKSSGVDKSKISPYNAVRHPMPKVSATGGHTPVPKEMLDAIARLRATPNGTAP